MSSEVNLVLLFITESFALSNKCKSPFLFLHANTLIPFYYTILYLLHFVSD